MGVDCRVTLPDRVRVQDVADVIAACAGNRPERCSFGQGRGWYADVPGVKVSGCDGTPGMASIIFPDVNGESRIVYYHFEWSSGGRGMLPPSTPFWVAIAKRLVDFFGGSVDYGDADDSEQDYTRPWREDCRAEDGAEWEAFQERKMRVTPLTLGEFEEARRVAAYTTNEQGKPQAFAATFALPPLGDPYAIEVA